MLGQTIEVVINDLYCHKNKCFGRFISWDNTIILAQNYKTKRGWRKYKQSVIESTFCHELAHCILYHSGNPDWMNEQLVESIAGLLHQYLTTNK
jgi:hypothetical protein